MRNFVLFVFSDETVAGVVGAGGQFHSPLFDKGGEQGVERLHDSCLASKFEESFFFDGQDAGFLDIAGDNH